MPDGMSIAGDIIQAAAALAGLLVIFVGNAVASFGTYTKPEQRSVLAVHKQRAWFGFLGVFLALSAVFLAVLAKWNDLNGLAVAAGILLLLALVWSAVCAWSAAREIK
jgi:hypothetical protein